MKLRVADLSPRFVEWITGKGGNYQVGQWGGRVRIDDGEDRYFLGWDKKTKWVVITQSSRGGSEDTAVILAGLPETEKWIAVHGNPSMMRIPFLVEELKPGFTLTPMEKTPSGRDIELLSYEGKPLGVFQVDEEIHDAVKFSQYWLEPWDKIEASLWSEDGKPLFGRYS